MEVCKISDVIRDARIRSGMTQEALAFGICSVSTLSKIENGRRMPQVRVFEALMDRMGESSGRCLVYVGQDELQNKGMQDQMTLAMLLKDRLLLETELAQYERLVQKRKLMDEQWLSLGNTVLQWWGGAALPDTEQRLTKILGMSCQNYREKWDGEMQYTYCEILIFQMLVQCRMLNGDFLWSISVLKGMRHYLKCGSGILWKERMLISVHVLMAQIYFITEKYPSSAKYSAKGLTISMNADCYHFAPVLLNLLAACEAKLGDTSEAEQAESCSKLLDAFMTSKKYLSKFMS